jgi:hypothetical protein
MIAINNIYTYKPHDEDDIFDCDWDLIEYDEDEEVEKFIEMRRLEYYDEWFQCLKEFDYYD